jgi:hypothetical protein
MEDRKRCLPSWRIDTANADAEDDETKEMTTTLIQNRNRKGQEINRLQRG